MKCTRYSASLMGMVFTCFYCSTGAAVIKESQGTYLSGGQNVRYELFEPMTSGAHASVVILPGTYGLMAPWGDDIRSFGKALAEEGVVAIIPSYFDRTSTTPGKETTLQITKLVGQHGDSWNAAIKDAIKFASARPNVDSNRIGLLGFSLGGNRALSVAMQLPNVERVVDFSAPTTTIPLVGDIANLPKLQMHHGTADIVVSVEDTKGLARKLVTVGRSEGVDFCVFLYPKAGHRFSGDDLTNSRKRTVEFLIAL